MNCPEQRSTDFSAQPVVPLRDPSRAAQLQRQRWKLRTFAVSCSLLLAACGGGGGDSDETAPSPATQAPQTAENSLAASGESAAAQSAAAAGQLVASGNQLAPYSVPDPVPQNVPGRVPVLAPTPVVQKVPGLIPVPPAVSAYATPNLVPQGVSGQEVPVPRPPADGQVVPHAIPALRAGMIPQPMQNNVPVQALPAQKAPYLVPDSVPQSVPGLVPVRAPVPVVQKVPGLIPVPPAVSSYASPYLAPQSIQGQEVPMPHPLADSQKTPLVAPSLPAAPQLRAAAIPAQVLPAQRVPGAILAHYDHIGTGTEYRGAYEHSGVGTEYRGHTEHVGTGTEYRGSYEHAGVGTEYRGHYEHVGTPAPKGDRENLVPIAVPLANRGFNAPIAVPQGDAGQTEPQAIPQGMQGQVAPQPLGVGDLTRELTKQYPHAAEELEQLAKAGDVLAEQRKTLVAGDRAGFILALQGYCRYEAQRIYVGWVVANPAPVESERLARIQQLVGEKADCATAGDTLSDDEVAIAAVRELRTPVPTRVDANRVPVRANAK